MIFILILIKSTGREMLTAYIKNKNNIVRFWLTVYKNKKCSAT